MNLPPFSYIELNKGKVFETKSFGPMVHGWTLADGSDDPEAHEYTQVLLDLAEDGTVLGIEILVPGVLTYEVVSCTLEQHMDAATSGVQCQCQTGEGGSK